MPLLMMVLLAVVCGPAFATPVLLSHQINDNDCSGYFGTGFDSCQIFEFAADGSKVELSPVIIKFDANLGGSQVNTLFPQVDGTEWSFSNLGVGNGTGDWQYTPDDLVGPNGIYDPAQHDPAVRYWAAKASNNFNLFWYVSAADAQANSCLPGSSFTLGCLDAALAVTSGSWATPVNPNNGNNRTLSHLTFYDSEPPRLIPPPIFPPTSVPAPPIVVLLLSGLVGLYLSARRRRGLI